MYIKRGCLWMVSSIFYWWLESLRAVSTPKKNILSIRLIGRMQKRSAGCNCAGESGANGDDIIYLICCKLFRGRSINQYKTWQWAVNIQRNCDGRDFTKLDQIALKTYFEHIVKSANLIRCTYIFNQPAIQAILKMLLYGVGDLVAFECVLFEAVLPA